MLLQQLQDGKTALFAAKPVTYGRVNDAYYPHIPQADKVVLVNFTPEGGLYIHKDLYLITDKSRRSDYGLFCIVGRYS